MKDLDFQNTLVKFQSNWLRFNGPHSQKIFVEFGKNFKNFKKLHKTFSFKNYAKFYQNNHQFLEFGVVNT